MQLPLAQIIPTSRPKLSIHAIDPTATIIASCPLLNEYEHSSSSTDYSIPQPALHSLAGGSLERLRYPLRLDDIAGSPRLIHPHCGTSNLIWIVTVSSNVIGRDQQQRRQAVRLWDAAVERSIVELTFPGEDIRGLATRRDRLAVVLLRRTILFHIDVYARDAASIVTRECEYETAENPLGLACMSTHSGSTVLALAGRQRGHVQIVTLPPLASFSDDHEDIPAARTGPSRPATDSPRSTPATRPASTPYPITHIFVAHTSALRTLTVAASGSLLATSSIKGTLLRVYDVSAKSLFRELRRGSDPADIWSIAFSDPHTGEMVACTSDKGTVHVWNVGTLVARKSAASRIATTSTRSRTPSSAGSIQPSATSTASSSSRTASLSNSKDNKPLDMFKPYLPAYLSSQWSDCSWRMPLQTTLASHIPSKRKEDDDVAICTFTDADSPNLLVLTRSGAFFRLQIADGAKVCSMIEYKRLGPHPDGDAEWSEDEG